MAKTLQFDSNIKDEMIARISYASDLKTFKKMQSVLIPLQCNTRLQETADLLGVGKTSVIKMRKEMYEELQGSGEAVKPNGGRRRQNMTLDEEVILLNSLKESALIGEHVDSHAIQKTYEEKLGRTVHSSTITRLLNRHGWVKLAPRKYHPKRNLQVQEAFKKTSAK